jgi:mannose-1-phosphate guanylyltransferase
LPSFFMSELNLHAPELAKHFPESGSAGKPEIKKINSVALVANWQYMEDAYRKVPALSVDIALAERTRKACAIQASFIWHDIGSWEDFAALFDKKETDKDLLKVHTSNCFVYSDIPAVLCGVRDIIAVVKNGKLLITKKGSSTLLKDKTVRDFIARLDKK